MSTKISTVSAGLFWGVGYITFFLVLTTFTWAFLQGLCLITFINFELWTMRLLLSAWALGFSITASGLRSGRILGSRFTPSLFISFVSFDIFSLPWRYLCFRSNDVTTCLHFRSRTIFPCNLHTSHCLILSSWFSRILLSCPRASSWWTGCFLIFLPALLNEQMIYS